MYNLSIKYVVAVVFTSFASFLFAGQTYNAATVEELVSYLNAAADGDTIQLADGTYPLSAKLSSPKALLCAAMTRTLRKCAFAHQTT